MSGGPYHLPLTPLYNVFCHWKKHLTHDFAQTVQIPFSDLRQPPANQITYDFCKCIAHAIVGEWLLSLGEISCKQGYAQKISLVLIQSLADTAATYSVTPKCQQTHANFQISFWVCSFLFCLYYLLFFFYLNFYQFHHQFQSFFHYSHMGGISQR